MTKKLLLQNLDCASCSNKIQSKVADLSGVSSINIDFVTKKMNITYDQNSTLESAYKIIHDIEPDVEVIDQSESSHSHNNETQSQKKQIILLLIGAVFFITGILIAKANPTISLIVFVMSYLLIGGDVVLTAIKNILKGKVFDENFLMTIATFGAFAIGEYPEAVAVMLFYQVGELFQSYAVNNSRKSIAKLMDIRPEFARIMIDGKLTKTEPMLLNIGDTIFVNPGDKIPVDGIIIDGNSTVDTSSLTGESIPVSLSKGDTALSGCINLDGVITLQVQKKYSDSTVAKILDLVENASSKKANTENFITKFAKYYTPAVVISALAIAFLPSIFIPNAVFYDWFYRGLVFLVVSCPCALVISIPLSFFGGIGGGSKKGILIKGGNYLEALSNADTFVFDKTGTLTKGEFKVTNIHSITLAKEELLSLCAHASANSNHPISKSILVEYNNKIDNAKISNTKELAGFGIISTVDNKNIVLGNAKLMEQQNIDYTTDKMNGTGFYVAVDSIYAGYIVVADQIKDNAKQSLAALKDIGVKTTIMLSGDKSAVANKVSKDLGIDYVFADLLPADKVSKMEEIIANKSPKSKVVFVGDGINDAPVLALSDIGIAMGGVGSDAAITASDIVLMNDNLHSLVTAKKLSKKTMSIVKQNIVLALGIKFAVLILSVFGFASIWLAIFADVGVSIIAIVNATRALRIKE